LAIPDRGGEPGAIFEERDGAASEPLRSGYVRREPETTVLYQVVGAHLETMLAEVRAEEGNGLPWFVEQELRRYLDCGILVRGFMRCRCETKPRERSRGLAENPLSTASFAGWGRDKGQGDGRSSGRPAAEPRRRFPSVALGFSRQADVGSRHLVAAGGCASRSAGAVSSSPAPSPASPWRGTSPHPRCRSRSRWAWFRPRRHRASGGTWPRQPVSG
jgi:hypothetical protein